MKYRLSQIVSRRSCSPSEVLYFAWDRERKLKNAIVTYDAFTLLATNVGDGLLLSLDTFDVLRSCENPETEYMTNPQLHTLPKTSVFIMFLFIYHDTVLDNYM